MIRHQLRALHLRRRALTVCAAAVLLPTLAMVSGCAAPTVPDAGDVQTTPEAPAEVTQPAPELVPEGSAEENLAYFTWVLESFAGGVEPVAGRAVADAVIAAGFDRSAMQVSFDRTQTDLPADNIFVSVRVGDACLLGQLTTADREVATMTAPTLGPERDICLIGVTRPIDW